jgi:Flp pilus assembly protein TadD
LFGLTLLISCGPDTIWVRPSLDTPFQHETNGRRLLERGKMDDACREFMRAIELDPQFTNAYIGLGLAQGRKGELQKAKATMDKANTLADSPDERNAVLEGYEQLSEMLP